MRNENRQPTQAELAFLGFRLVSSSVSSKPRQDSPLDIERVLFKLCLHLQEDAFDGRLASALMSWMKVHGDRVFVDRLRKMRERFAAEHGRDVYWLRYLSYFNVSLGRHSWKHLTKALAAANAEEFFFGNDEKSARALIDRWGLEPFLPTNGKLKVHRGALRVRDDDVLEPRALMVRNRQYRNRFLLGANVKCDVVTHMESGHFKTPSELSGFLGLSREAVRKGWHDYSLYQETAK
jgi:hypothetical protein